MRVQRPRLQVRHRRRVFGELLQLLLLSFLFIAVVII